MKRTRRHKSSPEALGAPPGSLTQRRGAEPTRVVARGFGSTELEQAEITSIDDLARLRERSECLWVEVTGLANTELIASIGQNFGLHALSLEDVFDPAQRGKVEHFDNHTFVVLKTLTATEPVSSQQLSLFFGERFVITFEEVAHPALEPIRRRLERSRGRLRSAGADFLTYALIDTVVDHYFPVVEVFDDRLEQVEDAILEARNVDPIGLTRRARQDLRTIRHATGPARDVVTALIHDDVAHLSDDTRLHLRDCYDHLVQLHEMIEASREIAASLLEAYVSAVSLRTNEVMKILTIIATIFIPLTFITGLYGMNFHPDASPLNMPELEWYWGYPFSLTLMLIAAVVSLLYIKKRGWFGGGGRPP